MVFNSVFRNVRVLRRDSSRPAHAAVQSTRWRIYEVVLFDFRIRYSGVLYTIYLVLLFTAAWYVESKKVVLYNRFFFVNARSALLFTFSACVCVYICMYVCTRYACMYVFCVRVCMFFFSIITDRDRCGEIYFQLRGW